MANKKFPGFYVAPRPFEAGGPSSSFSKDANKGAKGNTTFRKQTRPIDEGKCLNNYDSSQYHVN